MNIVKLISGLQPSPALSMQGGYGVTTQHLFILLPSPPHDKHRDWLQLIKYKLGSTFKLCILYQKTFHLEDVQGEEGHKLVNTWQKTTWFKTRAESGGWYLENVSIFQLIWFSKEAGVNILDPAFVVIKFLSAGVESSK